MSKQIVQKTSRGPGLRLVTFSEQAVLVVRMAAVGQLGQWPWDPGPVLIDPQLFGTFAFNLELLLELAVLPEPVDHRGRRENLKRDRGRDQPRIIVNQGAPSGPVCRQGCGGQGGERCWFRHKITLLWPHHTAPGDACQVTTLPQKKSGLPRTRKKQLSFS